MVPRLEKIDALIANKVHDSVLLCQSPRPGSGGKVLQRLRLSQSREWIS
jgi:hypothetical protein